VVGSFERWPLGVLSEVWVGICGWVEKAVGSSTGEAGEETLALIDAVMEVVDGMMMGRGHQLTEHIALGAVTALFRARNVTLLQKVYAWHIGKLEQAKEDKQLAMFMAAGLADIGKEVKVGVT
jgi:hypothetical protein